MDSDNWVCANCHSINRMSSKRCYSCGREPGVDPAAESERREPPPAAPTPAPAPAPIGAIPPAPAPPAAAVTPPTPTQPSSSVSGSTPPAAQPGQFCMSCGQALAPEARFCPTCGAPRGAASAPVPTAAAAPSGSRGGSSRRTIGAIAVVGIGAVLLAGIGFIALGGSKSPGSSGAPSGGDTGLKTVTVNLSVPPGEHGPMGSSCDQSNFGTLYMGVPGSKVSVTDEKGTLTGSASVPSAGVISTRPNADALFDVNCTFTFTVEVGSDARFYTFKVGTIDGPTFSNADMQAANWTVSMGQ